MTAATRRCSTSRSGLRETLDRLYPDSDLEAVEMVGVDGIRLHALVSKTPRKSIEYSEPTPPDAGADDQEQNK